MIQMRSPSYRIYGTSTGHLLLPNGASNSKTELHSVEMLAKGVAWKSLTTQAVAKTMDRFPQTDNGVPIAEDKT